MHNIYLLMNPIKGLLNYFLLWYPWVIIFVLLVVYAKYAVFVHFFCTQVYMCFKQLCVLKNDKISYMSSWCTQLKQTYASLWTQRQRHGFIKKIKYVLLWCIFISWGWFMTSVLFWSFNAGWEGANPTTSQAEFVKESTKTAKAELAFLEKEWILQSDASKVFEDSYVDRIVYALWFLALYVYACFVFAGLFFLISLGNPFLRNMWWLFVTLWLGVFFAGIVVQLYVFQLGGWTAMW